MDGWSQSRIGLDGNTPVTPAKIAAATGPARPEPEWEQGRRPRGLIGPGGGEEAIKAREGEAGRGRVVSQFEL